MYDIPTSITLGDKTFGIRGKGDYRVILDCFKALEDAELTKEERIIAALVIFYSDLDSVYDISKLGDINEAIKEMYKFFNCGSENLGVAVNYKVIDWDLDSQLICSAINNVAGKEVRGVEYLHWWTFMGYYLAIGESPLSTVVSIRSKIAKGKKLEKYESEFKRNNPQYFNMNYTTIKQQDDNQLASQIWNSGK